MKKAVLLMGCTFLISVLASCGGTEQKEAEEAENAFRSVLEGYDENAQYQLIYLNDDDIPELVVITDWTHNSGAELYAYIDGKAEQLYVSFENDYSDTTQFGSWGTLFYLKRQGLVYHLYDRNFGAGEFGFVCMWDGKSAEMQILHTYDVYIESSDEGKDTTTYYVDGEPVTCEEYGTATELFDHVEKVEYNLH